MVAKECVKLTSHFTNVRGQEPSLKIYHYYRKGFTHKSWKLHDGHYRRYSFVILNEAEPHVNPVCIPENDHLHAKHLIIPGFDATPLYEGFENMGTDSPHWRFAFQSKIIHTECYNNMTENKHIFHPDNENAQIICEKDKIQPCVDDRGGPILSLFKGEAPMLEGFSWFDHIPCQYPLHVREYLFKDVKELRGYLDSVAKSTNEKIITCPKVNDKHEQPRLERKEMSSLLPVEIPSIPGSIYSMEKELENTSAAVFLGHLFCIIIMLVFFKSTLRRLNGRTVIDKRQNAIDRITLAFLNFEIVYDG